MSCASRRVWLTVLVTITQIAGASGFLPFARSLIQKTRPVSTNTFESALVDDISATQADRYVSILSDACRFAPTEELGDTLRRSPELRHAIDSVNLTQWHQHVGSIRGIHVRPMLERHPQLMAKAFLSKTLHSNESIIRSKVHLSQHQWKSLKKRCNLAEVSRSFVRGHLRLLKHTLGLSGNVTAKVLAACPKLFQYGSTYTRATVDYLTDDVCLSLDSVGKIVKLWPIVLTLSPDGLRSNIDFLKTLEAEGWKDWRRSIVRYPQLLTRSVDNVLQPNLIALKEIFCLRPGDSAGQMAAKFPPVLWLTLDTLRRKVDFLRSRLQLTERDIRKISLAYPQIWGLGIESNMEPTIAFLLEHISDEATLTDFVLQTPWLLAFSLEKRLKPRVERLVKQGIELEYLPINVMSYTDLSFQRYMDRCADNWIVLPEDFEMDPQWIPI